MVQQLRDFADDRLLGGCIYCGGIPNSKEHVPSRILLEPPFPDNLPTVAACARCNNHFSRDEEYFACLVESVIAGDAHPKVIQRPSIAEILKRSPALAARIQAGRREENGRIVFDVDIARVHCILVKLARGHAAFELSTRCDSEPREIHCGTRPEMSLDELECFDAAYVSSHLAEVGSRSSQRAMVVSLSAPEPEATGARLNAFVTDWVEVQEAQYRYLAIHSPDEIRVKIVVREFLSAEVVW